MSKRLILFFIFNFAFNLYCMERDEKQLQIQRCGLRERRKCKDTQSIQNNPEKKRGLEESKLGFQTFDEARDKTLEPELKQLLKSWKKLNLNSVRRREWLKLNNDIKKKLIEHLNDQQLLELWQSLKISQTTSLNQFFLWWLEDLHKNDSVRVRLWRVIGIKEKIDLWETLNPSARLSWWTLLSSDDKQKFVKSISNYYFPEYLLPKEARRMLKELWKAESNDSDKKNN